MLIISFTFNVINENQNDGTYVKIQMIESYVHFIKVHISCFKIYIYTHTCVEMM